MGGEGAARIKRELGDILFDPARPRASVQVSVSDPKTDTLNDVQIFLEEYFRANGAVDAVTLVAAGEHLGVVTRSSLGPPDTTAAPPAPSSPGAAETGVGERLVLPGASTHYKLLKFRCRRCAAEAFGMHYDARGLEPCGNGHRQWEFERET